MSSTSRPGVHRQLVSRTGLEDRAVGRTFSLTPTFRRSSRLVAPVRLLTRIVVVGSGVSCGRPVRNTIQQHAQKLVLRYEVQRALAQVAIGEIGAKHQDYPIADPLDQSALDFV